MSDVCREPSDIPPSALTRSREAAFVPNDKVPVELTKIDSPLRKAGTSWRGLAFLYKIGIVCKSRILRAALFYISFVFMLLTRHNVAIYEDKNWFR